MKPDLLRCTGNRAVALATCAVALVVPALADWQPGPPPWGKILFRHEDGEEWLDVDEVTVALGETLYLMGEGEDYDIYSDPAVAPDGVHATWAFPTAYVLQGNLGPEKTKANGLCIHDYPLVTQCTFSEKGNCTVEAVFEDCPIPGMADDPLSYRDTLTVHVKQYVEITRVYKTDGVVESEEAPMAGTVGIDVEWIGINDPTFLSVEQTGIHDPQIADTWWWKVQHPRPVSYWPRTGELRWNTPSAWHNLDWKIEADIRWFHPETWEFIIGDNGEPFPSLDLENLTIDTSESVEFLRVYPENDIPADRTITYKLRDAYNVNQQVQLTEVYVNICGHKGNVMRSDSMTGDHRKLATPAGAEYTYEWDKKDNEGQDVPPGVYPFSIEVMQHYEDPNPETAREGSHDDDDSKLSEFLSVHVVRASLKSFNPQTGWAVVEIEYTLADLKDNSAHSLYFYVFDPDVETVPFMMPAPPDRSPGTHTAEVEFTKAPGFDLGDYLFLLQAVDDDQPFEKAHRRKPALEHGARLEEEALMSVVLTKPPDYEPALSAIGQGKFKGGAGTLPHCKVRIEGDVSGAEPPITVEYWYAQWPEGADNYIGMSGLNSGTHFWYDLWPSAPINRDIYKVWATAEKGEAEDESEPRRIKIFDMLPPFPGPVPPGRDYDEEASDVDDFWFGPSYSTSYQVNAEGNTLDFYYKQTMEPPHYGVDLGVDATGAPVTLTEDGYVYWPDASDPSHWSAPDEPAIPDYVVDQVFEALAYHSEHYPWIEPGNPEHYIAELVPHGPGWNNDKILGPHLLADHGPVHVVEHPYPEVPDYDDATVTTAYAHLEETSFIVGLKERGTEIAEIGSYNPDGKDSETLLRRGFSKNTGGTLRLWLYDRAQDRWVLDLCHGPWLYLTTYWPSSFDPHLHFEVRVPEMASGTPQNQVNPHQWVDFQD